MTQAAGENTADEQQRGIAALTAQVDELRRARDADRDTLDELMAELARRGAGRFVEVTVHQSWIAWVDEWLVPRISRSPHRYRWCHRYADHPEVADRLEALWHTWEFQWPDPLARSSWFRDGLDHHWPIIAGDDGPLRFCSSAEGVHESA